MLPVAEFCSSQIEASGREADHVAIMYACLAVNYLLDELSLITIVPTVQSDLSGSRRQDQDPLPRQCSPFLPVPTDA